MRFPAIHPSTDKTADTQSFWHSRYALGLVVMGAIASYFLLTEHLAHTLGALPYLLLAACPLMHLFMHHGHDGHGEHDHPADHGKATEPAPPAKAADAP